MHKLITPVLIVLAGICTSRAQSYEQLSRLSRPEFPAYCTKQYELHAAKISERLANALRYHENLLGFKPEITLLVLAKSDWSTYTSFPVYGMPHYTDDKNTYCSH